MLEATIRSWYLLWFNMSKINMNTIVTSVIRWIDAEYGTQNHVTDLAEPDRVNWLRCLPFVILHLGCLGIVWVGWSWTAVVAAIGLYLVRMFAITGIYHRYFSHRTYRTTRWFQFALAILGASATQRGPLWWAANHRNHHRESDKPNDVHSPVQRGFWWSHAGWVMSNKHFLTDYRRIQDFARFPELVWLNRYDVVIPTSLVALLYLFGSALHHVAPSLGVTGGQLVIWGFFISTTLLFHGTCTINSLSHLFGRRRYETGDQSRNNFWLALITLGEGWHNNHHMYMSATRQGFYWWEIDVTYYALKFLSWTGLIWDLKPVPAKAYDRALQLSTEEFKSAA
jgi:stearoyl-CoA desaturase (delta-9 desaturase)